MRRLALASAALLGACATPAFAQRSGDPGLPAHRDAGGCWVSSEKGPAFTVRIDLSGKLSVEASDKSWTFIEGAGHRIRIRAVDRYTRPGATNDEDPGVEGNADAQGFLTPAGDKGIAFPIKGILLLTIYRPQLALYREGEATPFATIENPYARADRNMRNCLVEAAKRDRGSGKPVVTKAKVTAFNITNDDYPATSLRANEQGRVAAQLTVSAHGVASDCVLVESSGSATLDQTTCPLIMGRVRFAGPALDADGQPTESVYPVSFTWRIPGKPFTPAAPLPQPIRQQ